MNSTDPCPTKLLDDAIVSDPGPAAKDDAHTVQTHAFTFTGSGSDYFRIWIVNLFLSIITLGVYSAWAKVRRLQYFDRNTQLAGASFDFDGDPKAILRGRVLAVVLVASYEFGFGFSMEAGVAVIALLLMSLPFMMRGALRFRLGSTRYRGLRFNFSGSAGGAYIAYVLPMALLMLWAAPLVIDNMRTLIVLFVGPYLAWPLMHGAMKRYQHRHLEFGSERASFDVPKEEFFQPYFAVLALSLAALVVIIGGIFALKAGLGGTWGKQKSGLYAAVLVGLAFIYVIYLVAVPYIQVRVGNMVWSRTSFPGVTISSDLTARGYLRLQTVNAILTLLSMGLYRPFAVVRAYKYRLAHITVYTEHNFERIAAGVTRPARSANSDGAADFLGLDLSW